MSRNTGLSINPDDFLGLLTPDGSGASILNHQWDQPAAPSAPPGADVPPSDDGEPATAPPPIVVGDHGMAATVDGAPLSLTPEQSSPPLIQGTVAGLAGDSEPARDTGPVGFAPSVSSDGTAALFGVSPGPVQDATATQTAASASFAPVSPGLAVAFAGNSYSTNKTNVPDSSLAVGTSYVVTTDNSRIQWYDKTGKLINDQTLNSFFNDKTVQMADSHVIYDSVNNRFVVETDARTSVRIAVSKDANPSDGWYFSSINTNLNINGQSVWSDFPGIATDGKAIYLTANLEKLVNGVYTNTLVESHLWIIKDGIGSGGIYQGGAPQYSDFGASTVTGGQYNYFGQAAQVLSPTPNGTAFLYNPTGPNNKIQIIEINNPTGSPTFQMQTLVGASPSPGEDVNVSQRGTTTQISANTVGNAVWQNGVLYVASTMLPSSGPDSGVATVQWMKINGSSLAGLTIADQGTVSGSALAGAGTATYLPAISADANGDFSIVFNASGPNLYAGAYYALHAAKDAAGTIEAAQVLHAGQDQFALAGNGKPPRFGDYSGMGLDPTQNEFWMFGEYAATRSSGQTGNWATEVGAVQAPAAAIVATSAATSPAVNAQTDFTMIGWDTGPSPTGAADGTAYAAQNTGAAMPGIDPSTLLNPYGWVDTYGITGSGG